MSQEIRSKVGKAVTVSELAVIFLECTKKEERQIVVEAIKVMNAEQVAAARGAGSVKTVKTDSFNYIAGTIIASGGTKVDYIAKCLELKGKDYSERAADTGFTSAQSTINAYLATVEAASNAYLATVEAASK